MRIKIGSNTYVFRNSWVIVLFILWGYKKTEEAPLHLQFQGWPCQSRTMLAITAIPSLAFVFFLSNLLTVHGEQQCPLGFVLLSGHCYHFSTDQASQNDAAESCRLGSGYYKYRIPDIYEYTLRSIGAELFEPRTQRELNEVMSSAEIAAAVNGNENEFWLGIEAKVAEGTIVRRATDHHRYICRRQSAMASTPSYSSSGKCR